MSIVNLFHLSPQKENIYSFSTINPIKYFVQLKPIIKLHKTIKITIFK